MGQLLLPDVQPDRDIQDRLGQLIIEGNVDAFVNGSYLFESIGCVAFLLFASITLLTSPKSSVGQPHKVYRYAGLLLSIAILVLCLFGAAWLRNLMAANITDAMMNTLLERNGTWHTFWSALFRDIGRARLELPYKALAHLANVSLYVLLPLCVAASFFLRVKCAFYLKAATLRMSDVIRALHAKI